MKSVSILEPHDIIDKDDWCRPLEIMSMDGGRSDYYSFKSQYSGTPENNAKWVRVKDKFGPIWVGSTVSNLLNKLHRDYEFVRGDVPESHKLDMENYTSLDKFFVDLTGKK